MSGAFPGFVRKEVIHLLRDPRTLAILILLPIVMILLFGFAVRTDVTDVRVAIVDPVPDAATLRLRARFEASARFRLVAVAPSVRDLEPSLRAGTVHQVVVLPGDLDRRLGRRDTVTIQLLVDGSDPNSSRVRQAYAGAVVRTWHAEMAGIGSPVIVATVRNRYNPTLESAHLFVPGLVAFVLTIVSALMTAVSLAREKETGTMEMLYVSPLRPAQIVLGKVAPYLVLGFADVLLLLVAARLIFQVPFRGSLSALLAVCLLYVVTSLVLGVVIASRVSTQRAAMLAALAGLMLPTLMLSGFIFPIASMPVVLQAVTRIVPARAFLDIIRGIMLQGAGPADYWRELAILGGLTLLLLAVAVRRLAIRLG